MFTASCNRLCLMFDDRTDTCRVTQEAYCTGQYVGKPCKWCFVMIHTWKRVTCLLCAGNNFFCCAHANASLWSHVHLVSTETGNSEYNETMHLTLIDCNIVSDVTVFCNTYLRYLLKFQLVPATCTLLCRAPFMHSIKFSISADHQICPCLVAMTVWIV